MQTLGFTQLVQHEIRHLLNCYWICKRGNNLLKIIIKYHFFSYIYSLLVVYYNDASKAIEIYQLVAYE